MTASPVALLMLLLAARHSVSSESQLRARHTFPLGHNRLRPCLDQHVKVVQHLPKPEGARSHGEPGSR